MLNADLADRRFKFYENSNTLVRSQILEEIMLTSIKHLCSANRRRLILRRLCMSDWTW